MKLSPFTPLWFNAENSDGLRSRYTQVWAPTDQILIEIIASAGESAPVGTLNDACSGSAIGTITWNTWAVNANEVLYFHAYQGLSNGIYTITLNGVTSEVFRVTSDSAILNNTTLIQYRNKDNKQREDAIFVIDNVPYFFDFRVPGGFKDSGWQFGVENEQFTTQYQDVVELYAREYTEKDFTMGNSIGVPIWFGEMLNRLLTCSYVYFDGERYVRSDSNTPSLESLVDGLNSFVFTQTLRQAHLLDPEIEQINEVALRRVDDTYNRITDDVEQTILII